MVVGVGGEVAGDVRAMRELRTVSRAQSAIGTAQPRPRRLFLSANYESLGNTRQPVTDALCASTITHTVSLSLSLSLSLSGVVSGTTVRALVLGRFTHTSI